MELKHAIESRASVRSFLEEAIPVEDLKEMVRLAGCAPSVNNYQPWMFCAITNKDLLGKMAVQVLKKLVAIPGKGSQVADNVRNQVEWYSTFFRTAPAVVALAMDTYETIMERGVILSHDEINKMRNFPDIQSAGAAIQNFLLAATDMGYGSCWMSAPMIAKDELEKMIGISEPYRLITFIAVGKPSFPPQSKEKKPVEEIFRLVE